MGTPCHGRSRHTERLILVTEQLSATLWTRTNARLCHHSRERIKLGSASDVGRGILPSILCAAGRLLYHDRINVKIIITSLQLQFLLSWSCYSPITYSQPRAPFPRERLPSHLRQRSLSQGWG